MAFNGNERLDARPGRAPFGEECEITVADIAPDQEATVQSPDFVSLYSSASRSASSQYAQS